MQSKFPIVSVIVPVFNVERYIEECIASICRQTYVHLEIIIIDDGSPDNCGKICDEIAVKDSRIKVIHKENGGLSSARNAGLDIAMGEYIVFVDSDDSIHPKYIEILLSLCERYDCDIAQCDFLIVAEDSWRLSLNPQYVTTFYDNKQALHEVCSGNSRVKFTVVWNKIYKRNLFKEVRYPIGRIYEDEFTTYKILWNIKKMVVTNQYLYYYLRRADSITGEKFTKRRLDVLRAFEERLCFLKEKKLEEEYQCTLETMLDLLEKNYVLVKENIKDSKDICSCLFKEKEKIRKQIYLVEREENEEKVDYSKIEKNCVFPIGTKIVLYGAGYWGKLYYHWINENCKGEIIGWVDNFWYTFSNMKIPVTPIDSLLCMVYDYILVAIKNKSIQEEIAGNLIGWGISKKKIRFIDSDNVEEK